MEHPHPVGEYFTRPPAEIILESTTFVPAGAVTIGVEDRRVASDTSPDAAAEFIDGGMSIHIIDAQSGHEYLRFDPFIMGPHYHYIYIDNSNSQVRIDETAVGSALDWALDTMTQRLQPMLVAAGANELAEQIDMDALRAAIPRVRELATADPA